MTNTQCVALYIIYALISLLGFAETT